MKARIKKTGEIVYVTRNKQGVYVDENRVGYALNDLDFGNEENEHWQDVRERAAIAAMQGVMNFFGSIDYNRETIAKLVVEQADALIEELKKKSLWDSKEDK